jgi:hypothetical protein
MKKIAEVILRGMITISILAVESVWGMLKGLWGESDRMARLFLIQINDPGITQSKVVYWVLEVFALFMQLLVLMVFFHFLYHVVGRYLHLW